jgi:hypothetical protein
MRVLKRTDEQIIIEEKPWMLGLLLALFVVGLCSAAFEAARTEGLPVALIILTLALGTGAIFAAVSERVWLILDRAANRIELRRRNLLRYNVEVFALSDLSADGILLQSNEDTFRIALRLSAARPPVPVTSYYQSSETVRTCAEAAREWLSAGASRPRDRL